MMSEVDQIGAFKKDRESKKITLPVDYGSHLSLNGEVVIGEEDPNRLDVGRGALVAVDHQLVVVPGLQDDVQDGLQGSTNSYNDSAKKLDHITKFKYFVFL